MAATASKNRPTKTASPQAPAPSDAALRSAQADHAHLLAIADKIEAAAASVARFLYDGGHASRPSQNIRDCFARIYREVAARPEQSWPPFAWPLAIALTKCAVDLDKSGAHVFTGGPSWQESVMYRDINALVSAVDLIRNPPADPQPYEVTLESIAELRRDHVGIQQIARIFDWFIEGTDHVPDAARVRAMEKIDPNFAPTVTRVPARDQRIPHTRPGVGALLDFCEFVCAATADDEERDLPAGADVPAEYADDPSAVADAVAAE